MNEYILVINKLQFYNSFVLKTKNISKWQIEKY
jgi:hypothetical protein